MSKEVKNLNKPLKDQLDLDKKQDKTDNSLATTDKTIVGAINELFQDVDNGKNLIANAIDNPLITRNSTFNAMSEAIEELSDKADSLDAVRNTLAGLMQEGGYDITGNESIDSLLDLLNSKGVKANYIKQIACSTENTYVLFKDGSLWACGWNNQGQLGIGYNSNDEHPLFIKVFNDVNQVSCGERYVMVVKNDGTLWGCGNNEYGQLGLGNKTGQYSFTQVTDMGNDVKKVCCTYSQQTYVIKNDSTLYACGFNNANQLGLGPLTSGTYISGYAYMKFSYVTDNVKEVDGGTNYAFLVKNDGSLWACGSNYNGYLGLGTSGNNTNKNIFTQVTININNDVDHVSCGQEHTMILKNDGSLWACGYTYYGVLGISNYTANQFNRVTENVGNDVKQVSCGQIHTMIVKNDGSVWACGGYGVQGVLGIPNISSNQNIRTFTKVTDNVNNDVELIECGSLHTFMLKNDGSLWSCGGIQALGYYIPTTQQTFKLVPQGINF